MSDNVYLTKEGFEKLKKELKALKGEKRREIADSLEEARLLGDLSENAEWESAKQAQAINEKRIRELEEKLMTAHILDQQTISTDAVYIGAKLKIMDMDSKEEISYTLVAEDEADYATGKISVNSPVGKSLLGAKKGDIVNIKIPAGILKYKILDISR